MNIYIIYEMNCVRRAHSVCFLYLCYWSWQIVSSFCGIILRIFGNQNFSTPSKIQRWLYGVDNDHHETLHLNEVVPFGISVTVELSKFNWFIATNYHVNLNYSLILPFVKPKLELSQSTHFSWSIKAFVFPLFK